MYDVVVIGSGAAGIMAAIKAKSDGKKVLLLEQQSKIAPKLKATGGGKCNLTNTLSNIEFMNRFGKNGRFMNDALQEFDHKQLQAFFSSIGVETHTLDGYRIFPKTHSSITIINGLTTYMEKLQLEVLCNEKVIDITTINDKIDSVHTIKNKYNCKNVIIASGGLGYENLGASGDGHIFAKKLGHKVTPLYPAMMPLFTKDTWVANCTADTIAKVFMYVDIKKHKKLSATGDLIFTKKGIRGPVVLDFAREITPLFDKYDEIPLKMNLLQGKNENDVIDYLKNESIKFPMKSVLDILTKLLAKSVLLELANIIKIDCNVTYKQLQSNKKTAFIKILCNTPLTISGHDGFRLAMITRGGISLKEINPKTMHSKVIRGLYFCGEVIDIDGPCGGYNLQWSFSSGYLSGKLLS
jgi:predicted Rossmann fold flavoprotein